MSVKLFSMSFRYGSNDRDAPEGIKDFKVAVERAGMELGNFEQHLWPKLQASLEDALVDQFQDSGIGQTGPWTEVTQRYFDMKKRQGFGTKTLVKTGMLRDSLTIGSAVGAIRRADAGSFAFGSSIKYASFHQMGTSRMPARPPLDLPDSFEKKLKRIMAAAARDALKEAKEIGLDLKGEE